jgi:pseudouridine synthase
LVRIQKHLAELGVASRRVIEEMVLEGRIEVNGDLCQELPIFVDPRVDEIRIDGQRVRKHSVKTVYYLLNKPKNVVCTAKDPMGRKKAVDLLGGISERVYCVGRLDADSTGALLLTNDGELTQHLTHPSHEVPKTYIVTVGGKVDGVAIETIKTGIYLDGRRTGGANIKVLHRDSNRTVLEITLREGRNREIRRMLERFGHKVRRLHRVRIGPVDIKGLGPGSFRMLGHKEVRSLYDAGKE